MKKGLSLFFFFLILIGMYLSVPIIAKATDVDVFTFELNLNKRSYTLKKCNVDAVGEIVIPEKYNDLPVTEIGSFAFSNCLSITSIVIPDTVTMIAWGAFRNCSSLINITIPDSVMTIDDEVFHSCSSLITITIPKSVKKVGSLCFYDCSSLVNINVDNENEKYTSIDGVLFDKEKTILIKYPQGKSTETYTIPNTITIIAETAFRCCSSLTSVSIPSSVTAIYSSAFAGCSSLKNIEIPCGVTSIASCVFSDCSSLTSITIPESVTSIEGMAFSGCSSLTNINIPNRVTSLDNYAFWGCSSITRITIPDSVLTIGEEAFYGCISLENITISKNITKIGVSAFFNTAFANDKSNWENGVLYIDKYLLDVEWEKTGLCEIKKGTKCIAANAFSDSIYLESVVIPDGIKRIDESTFFNCPNLINIIIPKSVTTIDNYAFYGCNSLSSVNYTGTQKNWNLISIGLYNENLLSAEIIYDLCEASVSIEPIENDQILFNFFNNTALFESNTNDDIKLKLNEVQIKYNNTDVCRDKNYSLDLSKVTTSNIVFSRENFQDYIIPKAVFSSWVNRQKTFDIYMEKDKKDSKPYISSVFARNPFDEKDNSYKNATSTTIAVLENQKYDVIVTAKSENGEMPETYWLSQGEGYKVNSTTGEFLSTDLYSIFVPNRPVYVYAIYASGIQTEPVKILLEPKPIESVSNLFNTTELDLFGKDGVVLKIPEDIPVVGGNKIEANIFKVPLGVQVEGNKIRVSLGFDFFSWSKETTVNGKGTEETEKKWGDYKNNCKLLSQSLEESKEKYETYQKYLKAYKYGGNHPKLNQKKTGIKADMKHLGYAEGYITNDGFVWTEYSSSIILGVLTHFKQQFLIAGLPPFYTYINGGGEVSFELSGSILIPDKNLGSFFNQKDITFKCTPKLEAGGGIGVKNAASIGFYGKALLPISYEIPVRHFVTDLKGEFGIEATLVFLSTKIKLFEGEIHIFDIYRDKIQNSTKPLSNNIYEFMNPEYFNSNQTTTSVKLLSREYVESMSNWLGEIYYPKQHLSSLLGIAKDITVKDLQTSVYKNSQLQLIEFNDTMMMAWIEDCEERDDYNRFRLVYSVYNPIFDTWSAPVAVDDNGRNDSAPSLATDGKNVYIAWQNLKETFTSVDDTTTAKILQSTEIKTAKFNSETGLFDSVKTLTNNNCYDYAPTVAVNNGVATICWVNSTTTDFTAGTLSVMKNEFSDTSTIVAENLNYVTALETNGTDISYSMDIDGDLTTDDVHTFTNNKQQTGLDEESLSTSELSYGVVDNEKVLFFVDNSNIHYVKQGVIYDVFESSRSVGGNINVICNNGQTTLFWTEITGEGTELFASNYENGEWTEPVQLTELNAIISNLDLVSYNDSLYGAFNRTNLTEETDINGETIYTKGLTDICLLNSTGFKDIEVANVLVDEEIFVKGELATVSVVVTNNGTEKVEDIEFNISDGLGTSINIVKNISIASGATEIVELPYTVPEEFTERELTISATVESDANIGNNSSSTVVGLTDVSISDMNIGKVGSTYVITGLVNNHNCIDAENVVVKVVLSDLNEELSTVEIGTIAANETKEVQFCVNEDVIGVTTEPKTVKFIAETTSKETLATNNEGTVAILHDEVDGCEHNYENWTVIKEATCTETGIQSSICTVCGIPNTEIIDFAHNHESEWIMDDEKHWKLCGYGCGAVIDEGLHDFEFAECYCGKIGVPDDASTVISIDDETTNLDSNKKLIITDKSLLENIYEILSLDFEYELEITPSHDFYDCVLLGTGSKVDVYYDDYLVDSYVLVVRGDVNGDSVCDALDCMLVELARNNHVTLEGGYYEAANLAEDSLIDVNDFNAVVNRALA